MDFYKFIKNSTKQIISNYYPFFSAGISVTRYISFSPFTNLPTNKISSAFQVSQAVLLSSVEGGMSYLGATITTNRLGRLFNNDDQNNSLPSEHTSNSINPFPKIDRKELLKLYIALLYSISNFMYKSQTDARALELLGLEADLAWNISCFLSLAGTYSDFGIGYLGGETFVTYLDKFGLKFSNSRLGVNVKKLDVSNGEDESVDITFKLKSS